MKSKFSTLILFLLASSALLLTGHVIHPVLGFWQMLLLIWCGWSGTYAVYHIGSIFTHRETRKDFLSNMDRKMGLTIFILHVLILLPILCWLYLPIICFWLFSGIFLLGLLYSLPFQFKQSTRIIKRIFLVKNMLIGVSWAALIPIGAGELDFSATSGWMFLFVALHIVMGSIIRDHSDIQQDRENGLLTLPLLVGLKGSCIWMSFANLFIFLSFFYCVKGNFAGIFITAITLHKAILLLGSSFHPQSKLWNQTLNISFNYVIFILAFILTYYGVS